jgi:uncharacterized protein (TIRG00374 family)
MNETGKTKQIVGSTGTIKALLFHGSDNAQSDVRIIDHPKPRIHHPTNAAQMVGSAIGVVLVLLLAVYAHGTTVGMTADLRGFTAGIFGLLAIPVNVLEGVVSAIVPVAVIAQLAFQRQVRQPIEALAAAIIAFAVGTVTTYSLEGFLSHTAVYRGLSVVVETDQWLLTIPESVGALAALLVVAGPSARRKTVRWGWRLLLITILIFVVTGQVSATGTLLALLIGSLVGHAVQFGAGVQTERAYGTDLVTAVERAGWQPAALIRISDLGQATNEATPLDIVVKASADSSATALARSEATRVYAMIARDGKRYDVEILDGDRQVPSMLQRWGRALQLRNMTTRTTVSLKSVTEHTALVSLSALAAGVRTPRLYGVGMDADSAALVLEHVRGAVALRDLPAASVTDDLMRDAWHQLQAAHSRGIAHHRLTVDVLLISRDEAGAPLVWLTGWSHGEIASVQVSRRLDQVQLLTIFAIIVGRERALNVAASVLGESEVAALSPLLQSVALPSTTRTSIAGSKTLLRDLRADIISRVPAADQPPTQITRFTLRTVIMVALTIVAVAVIVTTINFEQIRDAVTEANPAWIGISFGLSMTTWIGAALTLVAFAPSKLPFGKTILAQMAGSFVALATPAGIGPAALNLRYLNRKGIQTAMGVAVVALMQTSQVVITVLILLVLTLATGSGGLISLPSTAVLMAIGLVVLAVVALMLVPAIRNWAWGKVAPTLRQLWPRLSAMLAQPQRLLLGLAGNVTMSVGYVLAFYAALQAFGQVLNPVDVAVIFLVGNTVGALVPTPGGLGGVEGALIAGLSAAGVPVAIATSATLLFRIVTYWIRVPLGWLAMKALEARHDL